MNSQAKEPEASLDIIEISCQNQDVKFMETQARPSPKRFEQKMTMILVR
jgi:hypothetical protein